MERLKSSPDAKRGHLGEPGSRKVLWVVMARLNESPKEWPPLDQDRPEFIAVKALSATVRFDRYEASRIADRNVS